ncbi:MAG: right-handed parallel beta-helix repeat-containing protein [Propionibacteriaceae bacterium]|jgi:hypothetical protein|nr:right-handed parallel beta-helix repeat-containing protein [Propionibacteriaceae bacterium]
MSMSFLSPRVRPPVITVGGPESDITGHDGRAIQLAVDALGGPGVVRLAAGVFDILAPVRLRDGVTLTGAGPRTCLRKADGVLAHPLVDADYGERVVTVADPGQFRAGLGVQVGDAASANWECSTSVVTDVTADQVWLRDRLVKDYRVEAGCWISSACSVVEVVAAHGVRVENLRIDGNKARNAFLNGCRGGGVYLFEAGQCVIEGVEVVDFNGDGISWQITEDIEVRGCVVAGCTNYGLHPGTGALRSRVAGCEVRGNGTDGIYVCWRVQAGVFSGNVIRDNGRHGISLGHKDTDNDFEDNLVTGNAGHGVYIRPETPANGAHRNRFRNNRLENNGGQAVMVDGPADGLVLDNNRLG